MKTPEIFPALMILLVIFAFGSAPYLYRYEKTMITDEFVERMASEIYVERHKREPETYPWATWQDFLADPKGAVRAPVWRSDIRLGAEVITRMLTE